MSLKPTLNCWWWRQYKGVHNLKLENKRKQNIHADLLTTKDKATVLCVNSISIKMPKVALNGLLSDNENGNMLLRFRERSNTRNQALIFSTEHFGRYLKWCDISYSKTEFQSNAGNGCAFSWFRSRESNCISADFEQFNKIQLILSAKQIDNECWLNECIGNWPMFDCSIK